MRASTPPARFSPERRLVVNADDFGFTSDVNRGIIEAHRHGILTATTLMANGRRFEEAVTLAKENPSLDVGVHLVLVGGESLARAGAPLPRTVARLIAALAAGALSPYEELRAQLERVLEQGIEPTHLDSHKHTHLHPAVLEAVARLSAEFRVRWVRRPFDFPLQAGGVPLAKRAVSRALRFLRRRFHRTLARYGCRATDHFAGFQLTGRYQTRELIQLIEQLPEGLTEFMCHPGYCTDELRSAPTRLTDSRRLELDALVAPETRAALEEAGVTPVSYRQL